MLTYSIDEEPMFVDGVCIEEEFRPDERFIKEVASKVRNPFENWKSGTRLEDK